MGAGLPFLVGGLLNVVSIFLALAYLARVRPGATQAESRYEPI
jgi:hypothetical protein